MKKMNKDNLKVGYIVKIRNGKFGMIVEDTYKDIRILYKSRETSTITENLESFWDNNYDIVEVYGYNEYFLDALEFTSNGRKLLWKREEVKNMTLKEIESKLGYKIKIVSDPLDNEPF